MRPTNLLCRPCFISLSLSFLKLDEPQSRAGGSSTFQMGPTVALKSAYLIQAQFCQSKQVSPRVQCDRPDRAHCTSFNFSRPTNSLWKTIHSLLNVLEKQQFGIPIWKSIWILSQSVFIQIQLIHYLIGKGVHNLLTFLQAFCSHYFLALFSSLSLCYSR